jgi:hypothetical protein
MFWAMIDVAIGRVQGIDSGEGGLEDVLSEVLAGRLEAGQIVLFSRRADQIASRAGTWDLLAACRLIDGWSSDDAFRDFRDFLILAGREIFERAVDDADSLAEQAVLVKVRRSGRLAPGPIDDIAHAAWARVTGLEDEDDWFDAFESAGSEAAASVADWPRGTPWDSWSENEYNARLPRLVSLVGFR